MTINIKALFYTIVFTICPKCVAKENPDKDLIYAGSPPRLRNPTMSVILLVCCELSELSRDKRGYCSNIFSIDSRFSGMGPLVYAESWPSRNDIRSRRAWFGPLSLISLCSHTSGKLSTCYIPRLQTEAGYIAPSHLRNSRRQESHDISVSAFYIARRTSSLVSRVADSHPWSFTPWEPLEAGISFAWRNMAGARATIMRRPSWSRILVCGGYKHPPRR